MKTSSRKRLLVSSVAMLLVAMLALGTATFAWFTQNTTATADQLSVKTVKSSELQLAATTGEWTDQLHYNYEGKVLKPASSANGTNWFSATAAAKTNFAAGTDTAELNDLTGYVFKEQLNIRNNGGAVVDDVTISFALSETEAASGKYLRLALVKADKRGADAVVTEANFKAGVYASEADTADAFKYDTDGATIITDTVAAKSGASASLNIGSLNGKDATDGSNLAYYNLYVWFEGQDTDCYDANAGNEMPPITFSVTGNTVETVA